MSNYESLSDYKARMTLERRRREEIERQKRFCDEKLRTIGIDKKALDCQVREKKIQEEKLKREKEEFDVSIKCYDKVAQILENREIKKRRAIEKDLNKCRQLCQQMKVCSEPDELDGQMIIPGLKGEDPDNDCREERKKEQLKVWLTQQIADQAARRQRQALAEQCDEMWRKEMFDKAVELDQLAEEKRKNDAIANINCNLVMAEEKRRQEEENKEEDGIPSLCLRTILRPPQVSLLEAVLCREKQVEDNRRQKLREMEENDCYDRIRLATARRALLLERKQERLDKQLRKEMDCINAQLATIEKPDFSRGGIDETFFSQFNNCSR